MKKYKIGDILMPVVDDTGLVKCQVKEITTHECEGGTQTMYLCRMWVQTYRGTGPNTVKSLIHFSEIELKKWELPKKD